MPPLDWNARKTKWLDELNQLLSQIRDQLMAAGVARENLQEIGFPLNEEYLGQYQAPGLLIRIGASELVLQPKGTRIIGALGRVDVTGPRGRAKLIAELGDEATDPAPLTQKWHWFIYPEHGRHGRYPLTDDNLAQLLTQVLGD
ncbi:hypothetical protein Thiowin_00152 [Thiorhodovibrio winogradskyi]|uniref:Uncharacterized protein n=2 Tax=Thiorhodovibrio winogradskyi TaxID=77007 RepID=A0ABZ0S4I1_9GAMM